MRPFSTLILARKKQTAQEEPADAQRLGVGGLAHRDAIQEWDTTALNPIGQNPNLWLFLFV